MSEKNNSKQGRLNLNTLAEIFDVSIVTISRALNDKGTAQQG